MWGADKGGDGFLIGLNTGEHGSLAEGIVLEMELRRRSGRAETNKFVLWHRKQDEFTSEVTLLSEHPLFAAPADPGQTAADGGDDAEDSMETTFKLGLTDKQRKDREEVVPPYFDAQTDIGAGEGGRILYDMGREDDFDEEEDEI